MAAANPLMWLLPLVGPTLSGTAYCGVPVLAAIQATARLEVVIDDASRYVVVVPVADESGASAATRSRLPRPSSPSSGSGSSGS
jgi:hypothetical protein